MNNAVKCPWCGRGVDVSTHHDKEAGLYKATLRCRGCQRTFEAEAFEPDEAIDIAREDMRMRAAYGG